MEISASESELSAASLVERLVRILCACGVDHTFIMDQVRNSLESNSTMDRPRTIATSDGMHLRACQVVFRWRRDKRFLNQDASPALLNRGNQAPSFDDLVHIVLPNEDPESMLDYMLGLEAVGLRDEKIELLVESVLTCTGKAGSGLAAGAVLSHVNNYLRSVEFNLLEKPSAAKGRFERACYVSIPLKLVPIFERFMDTRGQDFIDVIDEWLERHRTSLELVGPRATVGAGAYMFVHPPEVPIP